MNWNGSTFRSASRLTLCGAIFDAPARKAQLAKTEEQINAPDFWSQPEKSQKVMQDRKRLEEQVAQDVKISGLIGDLDTLFELGREGENVTGDLEREMKSLGGYLEKLETQMLLAGQNDAASAIITIHPGAGGTESQDWAEMLLRMYLRWAEHHRFRTEIYDYSEGEEAGVKSVTVEITGRYAYGYMRSEAGTHRLIRLSPFDAAHRRHTSFAKVEAIPDIESAIEINIRPEDIEVDTYRSTGAGGQHVNKTDSAVRMRHLPSGIVVTCQNERSQLQNREVALKLIKARLYEMEQKKREEETARLKGEHVQADFGTQIRTVTVHPYNIVKDHRTSQETSDTDGYLAGAIDPFIQAYLQEKAGGVVTAE